ncbi:intercellular adhesion molecule 5 [Rhinichthys klamathensis goyatoka]|uniref:intercellular adhesion molecule 5 n=1 Tax=Rhinichthys klamathensis goyatoka TaxID=3034132 RepID=UPI0024B5510F|nr:intercellular adhesion molecule 5 [Rhinichthys klamathensis goyatoka]
MMEGNQYELQCDVLNVAPVQNLTVNWYKGQTLVDQTIFTDTIITPVSKTSKLLIRPDRADDGAQYWCEAKLELGEEGPQPPPTAPSKHLNITVYFKPIIDETKLPSKVPVFPGYPGVIVCEAEGNPKPTISWSVNTTDIVYSETLTITESTSEDLHCIANNSVSTTIRRVKVSIQDGDCPIQLNPQRVIVKFGSPVSADCSTSVPHKEMGWEASEGSVPMSKDSLITWRVSELREWDIAPFCYINHKKQCEITLPVTIYKTPDSVSISTVNHTGPMMEGNQYELQCDVLNVAPVQNLTVNWYKGQTLVDQTIFTGTIKTPVSKTSKLLIRPDRADDGAQYWCEAKLELGEEGPQPPPTAPSKHLNITVYYDCPISFNPPEVVVQYEASFSVNCSTIMTDDFDLSWEPSNRSLENIGKISQSGNVTNWEMQLTCHIFSNETQCSQNLSFIVYKTPDSVSISTVNHTGPMMEGNQYELQCDVLNVAPVQNLTVNWYKGQTLVDQTIFTDTIHTPVSKTSKLLIRPDRADDGAQYWCEAKLELGEEGPQPPPEVTSDPLRITVYFKPIIDETKLPSKVPVFPGYPGVIVCKAEGNPKPTISWSVNTTDIVYSETLTITESTSEDLHCIANNSVSTTIRRVKVSIQDGNCPIQLNPERVIVKFGGPVSADCSTSIPHKGLGWEASEGAVPMSKDSLITWRVSELREWDIEPFCYINHKKQCEITLPVTIYKTPDSVSISTVYHTGPMMEGNQYELQCDVLNVAPVQTLTVNWYKGQTLVDQTIFTDTIKTPVSKTSKLLIRPDRADDGAQYWCEAKLELGEEGPQPPPTAPSKHLNITVYYEPKIKHCKDWSPTTGASLDSYPNSYSLVGNPYPDISWRRKSSLGQLSVSILLNTYDSDQYEITASNDQGNSTCIINITVEYPPKLNCSESYEVKEKTPFQHPCVANGLPKPDVSLHKNGKLIALPYYPKWNDSGWYQLTASNKHGTVNSTFVLTILYAPVLHASQDKFDVVEDSNITLECDSTGNPEPKMSWSFKNEIISTGRRRIIFNIKRATSTSAGVYTCSASNQFGRQDKTFEVNIRGNSPNYITIVIAVIIALLVIIIIALLIYLWIRKQSSGSYQVQPAVKQYEMQPLSNGANANIEQR